MSKARLEAFTDGVIAIIITIMVLELKVPQGSDLAALFSSLPIFLAYVLSFINVGIFWNNHHHMLHATAIGRDFKGKLSLAIYVAAAFLAFVRPWIAIALYVVVALIWLVPDRRIERAV